MRLTLAVVFAALGASWAASPAIAGPVSIPVSNSSFESLSKGTSPDGLCYSGAPSTCAILSGWTNTDGYSFVSSGTDLGIGHYGDIKLAYATTSPDHGNFVAADGNNVVGKGTLSQMITGLTVGSNYQVTFYQAAGEQAGFSGAVSEQWIVGFGNSTKGATVMNYGGANWVNWQSVSLTFSATSTSELLSFLSYGLPSSGAPPFALLDGVSINDVPEPSAFFMLGAGVLGLILLQRRRSQA